MKKQANKMLELLLLKHKMTLVERDTLLTEIMVCYVDKSESPLMNFLLEDDFGSFKKLVEFMNTEGENIRECLKGLKNKATNP